MAVEKLVSNHILEGETIEGAPQEYKLGGKARRERRAFKQGGAAIGLFNASRARDMVYNGR